MKSLDLITLKSLGLISSSGKNKDSNYITEPYQKNYNITVNDESINGSYTYDLNILELHDCILRILENLKKKKIDELRRVEAEEKYKITSPQYPIERNHSIETIKRVELELKDLEGGIKKNEYITKVSPILNEYKNLGTLKKHMTFGRGIQIGHSENIDKKLQRFSIIERYLQIANKYMEINIYRTPSMKGCTLCGYDISSIESIENENIICPNCNMEITDISSHKNESTSNDKKSVSNYEGRVNFINELHRFQGKPTKSKIPPNLSESLDEHFRKKSFPIGDSIKSDKRLLKNTSKDLMYIALKSIGMAALYKDINLICHLYWGYELINLENLESQIMERYDMIDKIYETLKDDRSSSLNTQYELWWILDSLDFKCYPTDFKIPKTSEIFQYHEKMREKISKILNWKYVALNHMMI